MNLNLKVQVKLFGIFGDFLPPGAEGSSCRLDLPEEIKIRDIFARLEIAGDLPKVIICNGRVGEEDQALHEGDVVAIFSPIVGG